MTSDFHIVLIHGLNSYGATWRFMASHLAEQLTGRPDFVELSLTATLTQKSETPRPHFGPSSHSLSDLWTLRDTFFQEVLHTNDEPYGRKVDEYLDTKIYKRMAHVVAHNSRTKMYIRYTSGVSPIEQESDILKKQRVFALNFSRRNELSFEAQAYELQQFLSCIGKHTGISRFVMVGHSMGGLACRAWFQYQKPDHPEIEVVSCFCINTPHDGSRIAAQIRESLNTATRNIAQKVAQTRYKERIQQSIQKSRMKLTQKMLEHNTVYSGDFFTFVLWKHAGLNLLPDSVDLQRLRASEARHPERYDGAQWHFLGSIARSESELFDLSDGLVPIDSQMWHNVIGIHPRRVLFVHKPEETLGLDIRAYDERHTLNASVSLRLLFSPKIPVTQHLMIHAEPDVIDYVSRHCQAREK